MAEKKKKEKKEKNNEANWLVSNSAKLDCRTKQHTQFGVSASNGSRDMARTKSWRKKKRKKKIEKRKNERPQSHIASPTGIANDKEREHNYCRGMGVDRIGVERYIKIFILLFLFSTKSIL